MTTDAVPYLDGHCQSHGRPDQYHQLCPGTFRTQFGVNHYCICPAHEALGDNENVCDNGGEKSDPALRQQPGSRPNPCKESST